MFNFEINNTKKVFKITASGMFNLAEATAFVNELENNLTKIDAKNYTLIIDAKGQKASPVDVVPLQQKAMGIYMNTPFKKRYSLELDSAVTMAQIKRLGQQALLEKFEFVSSLDESAL